MQVLSKERIIGQTIISCCNFTEKKQFDIKIVFFLLFLSDFWLQPAVITIVTK